MQHVGKPWVAYVGPFEFPWGRAASRRVYFVAKAIAAAGWDVRVVSAASGSGNFKDYEALPHAGSIGFAEVGEFPSGSAPRRAWGWAWEMGKSTIAWLDKQEILPSHIIVYGGSLSYTTRVLRWARTKGVRVLVDVVEWYDAGGFRGGWLNPQFWEEEIAHRWIHGRADGMIVISSFLARYYRRTQRPLTIVPPGTDEVVPRMGDVQDQGLVDSADSLNLIYAGIPGKKDDLALVIHEIGRLRRGGENVKLSLLGPPSEVVERLIGSPLPDGVTALGRVPQEEVRAAVARADFSVLLRPDRRSSHAGFPTKFVESLSVGTPVIANITSDLGRYLKHLRNGIVVRGLTSDAVRRALEEALSTSEYARNLMRHEASKTAREFEWSKHISPLRDVLLSW